MHQPNQQKQAHRWTNPWKLIQRCKTHFGMCLHDVIWNQLLWQENQNKPSYGSGLTKIYDATGDFTGSKIAKY